MVLVEPLCLELGFPFSKGGFQGCDSSPLELVVEAGVIDGLGEIL